MIRMFYISSRCRTPGWTGQEIRNPDSGSVVVVGLVNLIWIWTKICTDRKEKASGSVAYDRVTDRISLKNRIRVDATSFSCTEPWNIGIIPDPARGDSGSSFVFQWLTRAYDEHDRSIPKPSREVFPRFINQ